MFWFLVVAIVIGAGIALAIAINLQRKRFQQKFRLEIANEGNVRSRYQLRAEDPEEDLCFRFSLNGESLPQGRLPEPSPEPAAPTGSPVAPTGSSTAPTGGGVKAQAAAAGAQAEQAMARGSAVADVLASIGSLLPSSIGNPLLRKAGQIQSGQMRIREAQQAPRRAQAVAGMVRPSRRARRTTASTPASPATPGSTGAPATGHLWVETPIVRPNETLSLDLLVKAAVSGARRSCLFRIISRSVEQEKAPQVVQENHIVIGGGFWGHRILPYLAILTITVAALLSAIWLAANGVLPW